jgi:AIPR protein.
VVNGAQTVHAIHAATQQNEKADLEGFVNVRVISLKHCPPDFADRVTKATNTQNRVERRDFVALDPLQAAIREDFALSLQKTYVVKRGEPDPPPESGCSVVTAATALACAHRNPELAMRAKRSTDLLWEEGSQGAYNLLFSKQDQPSAHQIWRSVLILRQIDDTLYQTSKKRQARAEAIAERGNRLIAHIVFQYLDLDGIDDPDTDFEPILAQVPEAVEQATSWLIHYLDSEFGTNSIVPYTLANVDRCRTLVELVLSSMREGGELPTLPKEYRRGRKIPKQRRPNAVPTLVDAERLADGTRLVFQPSSQAEREALSAWLAEDPRRGTATWVNQRVRPLLWEVDGKRYSPSGLVQQMHKLAGWANAPVATQGPSRWYVPGEGSLWELALETLESPAEDADEAR